MSDNINMYQSVKKRHISDEEVNLRIFLRDQVSVANAHLIAAAQRAGVTDFAQFHNAGYQALYDRLTARKIAARKGLTRKNLEILNYMDSMELAINLSRITQTCEKLQRDAVSGQLQANRVHRQVGIAVRRKIEALGGTMPEDLPTPIESVKTLQRRKRSQANATPTPITPIVPNKHRSKAA